MGRPEAGDARAKRLLFAFALLAFLLVQEGAITGSDGASMYEVTRSIVREGDLSVPPALGVLGEDGASYSKYGVGLSLVAVIPYVAALPVAAVAGDRGEAIERFAVSCTIPILSALLVVALYALARRLGGGRAASGIVAFGAVAGTFLLPYTKEFFSEPLATLAIVVAIERALAGSPGWTGAALAAGVVTRPQTLAVVPLVAWGLWRTAGVAGIARAALPLAAGIGVTAGYNLARFGDVAEFGYAAEPGFSTPFVTGARGLLLEPSDSLLLFAPIAVLLPAALAWLWRTNRTPVALLAGNLAITFVITALWHSWAGGWSWGPRLLIPGVAPAIAAVAPWATDRGIDRIRATVLLFLIGAAVSGAAMLVSTRAQQLDQLPPAHGPGVVRQYELLDRTTRFTIDHVAQRDEGDHRRFLSLWQVNVIGVLGNVGLLLVVPATVALLGGVVVSGRALSRELRAQPQAGEP